MVALEAMACGKVVIGYDEGGIRETAGKVGFLCGDDPSEWRAVIQRVLSNPDAKKLLELEGIKFARKFSWDNTAFQIKSILQNVLDKRSF